MVLSLIHILYYEAHSSPTKKGSTKRCVCDCSRLKYGETVRVTGVHHLVLPNAASRTFKTKTGETRPVPDGQKTSSGSEFSSTDSVSDFTELGALAKLDNLHKEKKGNPNSRNKRGP